MAFNNPVYFVDIYGRDFFGVIPDNLSGIGSIQNNTGNNYSGAGSTGKNGTLTPTTITPGNNGGSNTDNMGDTDFIYPTPSNPINGMTCGKFKIGANDAELNPNPKPGMPNNANLTNFRSYDSGIPSKPFPSRQGPYNPYY